ncbi:hypothetical protein [Paraburkholderia sp. A1RO-1]|uniref:hypothetical protein n=1 Tax=Paraburkholderia sp. A1RO-1 TaxID=3028368 RepID=UPI003B8138E7
MCIVVGTEQGFVGALNDELVEYALRQDGGAHAYRWLLVGSRLASAAASRGLSAVWSAPMAVHPDAIPQLAVRITDALYARLAPGQRVARISVVSAQPGESRLQIAQRILIPFDFTRFRVSRARSHRLSTSRRRGCCPVSSTFMCSCNCVKR